MGDEIYRPLIEDMTWSYSRLKCFEDCRYRWYLQYIEKLPECPQFYSSYGTFMHRLLAGYYSGRESRDETVLRYAAKFGSEVAGERPSPQVASSWFRQGLSFLRGITALPYKPLAVEREYRFFVGGYPFVGYIDYLGENDGKLAVVDHKSSDIKPPSRSGTTKADQNRKERLRQLYLYSAAVRENCGRFPDVLCFNCFRTDEFIEVEFDAAEYEKACDWATGIIETALDCGDFYPGIEYYACRYICGQKDNCCYNEGGEAYQE